jgi:Tfp pilus assembly protein PilF
LEALEDLRVALRMAPEVAETHYAMGLAHQALGQEAEARQAWERALSLEPSHTGARRQLSDQRP